ncbi:F-box family protein, putative [Theobroma cacao]|uniref:F-box family protein, putative n=1 Tax=Theobroma cacao TaxID=3641 RepID=A0A061G8U3_THECC|nr:F-box family protein, putative [Theobroma cacao]
MGSRNASELNLISDTDVMIDILLRLPLKTLMGCKCVCKWWNNLISDPTFKSNYSRRNPQYYVSGFFLQNFLFLELRSELLFFPYEGQIDAAPEPSLSFIEDDKGVEGVRIEDSCNGLLLCSSFPGQEKHRPYYICKPTTKQYLPLPYLECRNVFSSTIAYDPNKSPHYKIVCICASYLSENHCQIKIFSPVTGSWKVSGKPFPVFDEGMLLNRGVFFNGILHWIGRRNLALRFDLEREVMLTMPMPPIPEGWTERKVRYFGESGGHLFLIETYGALTAGIDVKEMKSDYSGWFVKYHLNLDTVAFHSPGIRRNYKLAILHIAHQHVGDEDESFMVIHVPGEFVSFKLKDNTLKELQTNNQVNEDLGLWYSWEGVYPYSNTDCYL